MGLVKELLVDLQERSYSIFIGEGMLAKLDTYLAKLGIGQERKIFLISDENVSEKYAVPLHKLLQQSGYSVLTATVPAGEASKSMEQYARLLTIALEAKLDRHSVILALGGGVVGDLAGFVASTYMRGIPFVQLPTTILAHDSSVGGKVAINHPLGKNMIGSFYQPKAVIYDTTTLHTLPRREVLSGLAEVVKHGLIWDASFVHKLHAEHGQILQLENPYLADALYTGCSIKAQVVSQDEKEQGMRALLNFGHTFGHALEALGNYQQFTHGEAISIGMSFAARLSERVFAQTGLAEEVISILSLYGLPFSWENLPWSFEEILEKMYNDKKTVSGKLNFVLLAEIGRAELVKNIDPQLIKEVWEKGVERL